MKVTCGNCRRELQIPQCLPGTMLMCPHCKQWTQVPTSSADQWFAARKKEKLGPFSLKQLKQLASAGKLRSTDMLLEEGTAKWMAASVVGNLFPPASAQMRPLAPTANSMQAPARRKKAAASIAVIAVQATAITALLIGVPIIFISVWGVSNSSQDIERIRSFGKGQQEGFDEIRKREGYDGGGPKPLNKDKEVAQDKTTPPPNVHEPMQVSHGLLGNVVCNTKKEIEDFADNTSRYKGKTITVVALYCDFQSPPLREGLPDTRKFMGVASDFQATFDVKIKIESDDGLPNAKYLDVLVITFLCGEGELTKGNKLISAKRK
jgi:hypothetical protein